MNDMLASRRGFLNGSCGVLMGTLMFTSSPIVLLALSTTWALMKMLNNNLATRLIVMVLRIHPHDRMKDAVYAYAIKAVDDRAVADPSVLPLLEQGLGDLDNQQVAPG